MMKTAPLENFVGFFSSSLSHKGMPLYLTLGSNICPFKKFVSSAQIHLALENLVSSTYTPYEQSECDSHKTEIVLYTCYARYFV